MTLEEQKQMAIDNYVNLMRIKADEKAEKAIVVSLKYLFFLKI